METRVESVFSRLERLVPPPDAEGWHFARLNLEANSFGGQGDTIPSQDEQASAAEMQLGLGAVLSRVDANPTDWDTTKALGWKLVAEPVDGGAAGYFLDVWGRTMGVGRLDDEADPAYATRILESIVRARTTNLGLAEFIEKAMSASYVEVLDAANALTFYRLNEGWQFNDEEVVLNCAGDVADAAACFIVRVPISIYSKSQTIAALVEQQKTAGTRLVGIMLQPTSGFGYGPFGTMNFGE